MVGVEIGLEETQVQMPFDIMKLFLEPLLDNFYCLACITGWLLR